MENATKGLMIAGAILIAIVLIGIGVFLVSQAQDFMGRGTSEFDDMTKQLFNSPILQYEGTQKGSNVRELINNINSTNMDANREATYAEKGIKVVFESSITSIVIDGTVEDYVSSNATRARSAINTGKTYYVSVGYNNKTGLINVVGIAATDQDTADDLVEQ